MADIESRKVRDALVIAETQVKTLARLVGYNEIGEPIELVFDAKDRNYEWHVGGEFINGASQQSIEQFVPAIQ